MDATDAGGGVTDAPRVVVIGGGVGGLATAAILARGGADVTLLERHDAVGGRAGRVTVDGYTFDTGPSWYLMPEAFEQFFALLGRRVEDELDLIDLDPRYRVYFEGDPQPLDVAADAETNYAHFNEMSPGDGDAIRAYVAESGSLYRLALDRFLYTTFERPLAVVNSAVARGLPRLASLLTRSLSAKIEGRVRDPRLRQILGFHAVFLGSSPRRAPSLFSLMSHLDLADGVRYPRGGMFTVIEALERVARAEGATIRTGADVTRILVEDGLATGVELAGGEVIGADVVVSAADLHHTETELLPTGYRTHPERTWSRRGPGIGALLVMAGVEGPLPQLAHHTLFFARDWDKNFAAIVGDGTMEPPFPASLYVCKVTATEPSAAPAGHESLFMLVPFPADPELGATAESRAALEGHALRYLEQIAEWADVPDLMERKTILRVTTPSDFATSLSAWRGSALGLEHTVRQSAMFRPANLSARVPNLLYAGSSTTPGIGVPICLISAELVAKRMLGATSVGPLPTPAPPGFLSRSVRRGILGDLARRAQAAARDGGV